MDLSGLFVADLCGREFLAAVRICYGVRRDLLEQFHGVLQRLVGAPGQGQSHTEPGQQCAEAKPSAANSAVSCRRRNTGFVSIGKNSPDLCVAHVPLRRYRANAGVGDQTDQEHAD